MQLDEMNEVRKLLVDIDNLFTNLDDIKKKLEDDITLKNYEQEDYLHELELSKLNGIEIMGVAKLLIQARKKRRVLKNKLELVNTIKGYTDKYITKGIIAETKQVIKNIDTLKENQENRAYNPRIVKDLKCAKKKRRQLVMKSKRAKATDISNKIKKIVWERDEGKCVVCGSCYNVMPNAHFISRKNGGLGIEQNIVTLCTELTKNKCHRKYDFGTKEEREKIGQIIENYLKSYYKDWNKENLIYRKVK